MVASRRGLVGTRSTSIARGERHPKHKLTEEKVIEARKRWEAGDVTIVRLAEDYGVSISVMSAVVHYRSWKEI
jgi:hypothetical protein